MDLFHKKILIVEDEEAMLEAVHDAFVSQGFMAYKAKNGEEGLKIALDNRPDILLIDILMPKMDGMELMQKLREDDWGKSVPVVLLTNVNPESSDALRKVLDYHPAFYLIKSDVMLEEVVRKVKEVLKTS